MILEHEQWYFGYDQILKDCRPHGDRDGARTVLLLCNADVDAMSSARILSYMLRSDGIHYQLLPCTCYSDLENQLSNTVEAGGMDDVSSIILFNFGAARNLTRLYERNRNLLQEGAVKMYVMDCRRPIHLANVYSPSNVVIFLDSTQKIEDMPSDGDNLSGHESSSESESSSSSDDDDNSEEEGEDDDEEEEEAKFDDIVGETETTKTSESSSSVPHEEKRIDDDGDASYDAEDENEGNNEDDGDGDNDGDNDDNENHSTREFKRRKSNFDSDDTIGDITPNDPKGADGSRGDNENSEAAGSQSQSEPSQTTILPRELHSQRLNRLRKYYSDGSFYGSPSAFVAYRLASQHRYGEQGDLLWLACVGVTDAYLHARLDLIGYAKLAKELSDFCLKLYPNNVFDRALNTVYAEDLVGQGGNSDQQTNKTKIALSENGRIFSEKDFRFFMLRHSSLLDSMQYSDYVCTRLRVYTKKGERQLMEMLAKMGYPLDECRQPFPFMRPSLRRRLKEKLGTHAPEYNLDRFEFTSFTRVTGYSSLLSASDTSYAVTALLECDAPSPTSTTESSDPTIEKENKVRVEAFNNAYDALGSHASEPMGGLLNGINAEGYDSSNLVNGGNLSTNVGIGAGLRRAMVLQKNIINTAVGLSERGAITLLRHFRYAHVTSSSIGGENQLNRRDLIRSTNNTIGNDKRDHMFSKPLALTRLAHFLMDMNRENGKWTGTKARPLVLIADRPQSGTCLIVGYEYPERAGDFVKNTFGKNFEDTAKSMNGTFRFDSFDSNVVEVDSGDVQRFMEQLHYLLDQI